MMLSIIRTRLLASTAKIDGSISSHEDDDDDNYDEEGKRLVACLIIITASSIVRLAKRAVSSTAIHLDA